jgi:hypothetical protein
MRKTIHESEKCFETGINKDARDCMIIHCLYSRKDNSLPELMHVSQGSGY